MPNLSGLNETEILKPTDRPGEIDDAVRLLLQSLLDSWSDNGSGASRLHRGGELKIPQGDITVLDAIPNQPSGDIRHNLSSLGLEINIGNDIVFEGTATDYEVDDDDNELLVDSNGKFLQNLASWMRNRGMPWNVDRPVTAEAAYWDTGSIVYDPQTFTVVSFDWLPYKAVTEVLDGARIKFDGRYTEGVFSEPSVPRASQKYRVRIKASGWSNLIGAERLIDYFKYLSPTQIGQMRIHMLSAAEEASLTFNGGARQPNLGRRVSGQAYLGDVRDLNKEPLFAIVKIKAFPRGTALADRTNTFKFGTAIPASGIEIKEIAVSVSPEPAVITRIVRVPVTDRYGVPPLMGPFSFAWEISDGSASLPYPEFSVIGYGYRGLS